MEHLPQRHLRIVKASIGSARVGHWPHHPKVEGQSTAKYIGTCHNDTQNNQIQHNKTHHNDNQHNDTEHNYIQHNDTHHNDNEHNYVQHNDTHHNDNKHNYIQHNNEQNVTLGIMTLA